MLKSQKIHPMHPQLKRIKALYDEAFPIEEQIPFFLLLLRGQLKDIDFLAIYEEDQFIGFIYTIFNENLAYLLYLAILPTHRMKGYGSRILDYLKKRYENKTIVLEIEAITDEQDTQKMKRKAFYVKNGFQSSNHGSVILDVDYEIMISQEQLDMDELQKLYKRIFFGIVKMHIKPLNHSVSESD